MTSILDNNDGNTNFQWLPEYSCTVLVRFYSASLSHTAGAAAEVREPSQLGSWADHSRHSQPVVAHCGRGLLLLLPPVASCWLAVLYHHLAPHPLSASAPRLGHVHEEKYAPGCRRCSQPTCSGQDRASCNIGGCRGSDQARALSKDCHTRTIVLARGGGSIGPTAPQDQTGTRRPTPCRHRRENAAQWQGLQERRYSPREGGARHRRCRSDSEEGGVFLRLHCPSPASVGGLR